MRYLDFKVGHKYEVLADPTQESPEFYQGDFKPGEIFIFKGHKSAVHESYKILRFEKGLAVSFVKFGTTVPEPKWEKYFREVKGED
jgi:hypothetical protein